MGEMLPEPMVTCSYGWGRVLRLYQNHLDLNGTIYVLTELVRVRPVYRHVLGVSSASIELFFKERKVVLRGIAAVAEARKLVEHLSRQLVTTNADVPATVARPTPPISEGGAAWNVLNGEDSKAPWYAVGEFALPGTPPTSQLISPEQVVYETDFKKLAQDFMTPIEMPRWQRIRQEQRERRLNRLRSERSMREHGFDVERLAQRLREGILPEIQVPVHLLPDEYAYYRANATLCGEPLNTASRHYQYEARDCGTLILTSERIIYLGRKCQIILGYTHLLHVSRLRKAVAFMAEHWSRREVFEVARPLECTMYLEHILQRFQQHHPSDNGRIHVGGHYVLESCSMAEELSTKRPIEEIDTVRFTPTLRNMPAIECDVAVEKNATAVAKNEER